MNTSDADLVRACTVLFRPDIPLVQFLAHLHPSEIRRAYRERAFLVHPDRVITPDEKVKRRCTEAFLEVNWAYHRMMTFIEKKDLHLDATVSDKKRPRPRSTMKSFQEESQEVRFYRGPLPRRPLFFGEFLYYSGLVPWRALIEAIVWQRRQRPRFGEIARRWSHLSTQDLDWIIVKRRPLERIGEAAVRHEFLTQFQANTILYYQRLRQRKIGEYFVEKGYLTERKVKDLLIRFERSGRPFGFRGFK